MHIEKGKNISKTTILRAVESKITEFNRVGAKKIKMESSYIEGAAESLHGLNVALLKGHSVWFEVEKQPRNWDAGSHYYTIWYNIIKDGKAIKQILWLYEFTIAVHGVSQDKDRSMRKYVFKSGAIGMSRVLDATDGVFTFLKSIGGCYAQL
jgi:hypothetical protein